MLCDELVAAGRTNECGLAQLIPKLKSAQKFVLDSEFASVAEALAEDYTGLVRVFDQCRLPYADTWVELAQGHRPRFYAAGIRIPAVQLIPRRVGFLLSATKPDLSAWKAHLFWNLDAQTRSDGKSFPAMLNVSLMAVLYDMQVPFFGATSIDSLDRRGYGALKALVVKGDDDHPGWRTASDEVKLMMSNHTAQEPADVDWQEVCANLKRRLPDDISGEQAASLVNDLARADWAGETAYVLAVVGLLNARNAVETELVDRVKMNKSRLRAGKPPMFSHHVLKIHRRQQARVEGSGPHNNHAPMRLHMCRGHFKHRKSGIYFWSPHLRGDKSRGMVTKDYEVVR